jgi:CRP/FNR family transcriptional regulator, dissimilatory nitrate respiration regulator
MLAQQQQSAVERFLASVQPYAALDERALKRLAKTAAQVDAPKRTVIFRPGDPAAGIHIVMSGHVKLSLPARDSGEKVIAIIGPGQSFGELGMFLHEPHMLSAESTDSAKLVRVDKAAILTCIKRNPQFAAQMIATLGRRLRDLIREIDSWRRHSGPQRVVEFLAGELPAEALSGSAAVLLPAKKRVIASRLDLTHEHFSRILRDLTEAGLISVDGPTIVVRDVRRLREVAANSPRNERSA